MKKLLTTFALASFVSLNASAAIWSSTNVQYLYAPSNNYKSEPNTQTLLLNKAKMQESAVLFLDGTPPNNPVPYNISALDDTKVNKIITSATNKKRSILTLEHVNGWSLGDNYFFFDVTNPMAKSTDIYGEYTPRLSIGKMTGTDLSYGFVKDVLLVGSMEATRNLRSLMYGVGFDLNIPYFNFFSMNVYKKQDSNGVTGDNLKWTEQVTLAWSVDIPVAHRLKFNFNGFMDITGKNSNHKENIQAQPQFLLDVGELLQNKWPVYVGVEQQIWKSKFGIKNNTENVTQAMIKVFF
jgi:nucleoside-specific outer membrane channel protein Tsx